MRRTVTWPNGQTDLTYPTDQSGPRNQAGFTLIELMVVIVLIAVFSAMIVPEMKGSYEEALLRSTGRQLIDAFSLASSRAVSLNKVQRVRLAAGRYLIEERVGVGQRGDEFAPVRGVQDAEGELDGRVTILFRNAVPAVSSDEGTSGSQESPEKPLLHYDNLPDGESQSASSSSPSSQSFSDSGFSSSELARAITFFPDGTAEERQILLRDRSGSELTLRVNPITSRVDIVEVPKQ